MTTTSASRTGRSRRGLHSLSLPARTGVALAVAVLAAVALSQVLAAAVDADPDFLALQPGPVAAASAVGVLLGAAAYVALRRLGRPRLFLPLIAVGALLSLGGPLGLLGASQADQPGVSDAAALALVPLHLLVAVVVAVVLPRRAR
jgi:peptidoglycan/LPS O-acetylase OafA/YrhL